jgi:hypothetical protein
MIEATRTYLLDATRRAIKSTPNTEAASAAYRADVGDHYELDDGPADGGRQMFMRDFADIFRIFQIAR